MATHLVLLLWRLTWMYNSSNKINHFKTKHGQEKMGLLVSNNNVNVALSKLQDTITKQFISKCLMLTLSLLATSLTART